jgi:hypothetical protein
MIIANAIYLGSVLISRVSASWRLLAGGIERESVVTIEPCPSSCMPRATLGTIWDEQGWDY